MKRLLVLEDGSTYEGIAIGSDNYKIGELVFNTSVSGYQEVFTDLSSAGQIVVMTYPLIGNCGINRDDYESINPSVYGIVIKDECKHPSNWRYQESLNDFLLRENIAGIADIDTRALTIKLRDNGSLKATFANEGDDIEEVVKRLKDYEIKNLVGEVSSLKTFSIPGSGKRVAIIDFGIKLNILKELTVKGFDIIVLPYDVDAKTVRSFSPDGVFLSNGPSNPNDLKGSIETIKELLPDTVIMGVGLGHELLALASGAKVTKMKVGHHGSNPVLSLKDNKVVIANQNHNYVVDKESIDETELTISHIALNDGTVEGLVHNRYQAFSVQFYPEDSIFDEFNKMMEKENPDA